MLTVPLRRRDGLKALLLAPFAVSALRQRALAAPAPELLAQRVVAVNWAAAETLLTLGITPLAISDSDYFRRRIARPPLPATVQDIGPFWEPNYELLTALRPSVIYSDPFSPLVSARMATIAPVEVMPVYPAQDDVWLALESWTRTLAARFAREAIAERWLQDARAEMAQYAHQLTPWRDAQVVVMVLNQDGKHGTVYGAHSLAQAVLRQLGLRNAWQREVSAMGTANVGIEQIASLACDRVFYTELPTTLTTLMRTRQPDGLWQQFPAVRQGRVAALQHFFPFGGMATALTLARQIAEALGGADAHR